uniref:Uncharacterized protein n=1 Tax=Opuntia streptacantha TaxID=393608 RepID=A0A7C9DFZ6_OPUST
MLKQKDHTPAAVMKLDAMRLRSGWPRSKNPPVSKLRSSSSNDGVFLLTLLPPPPPSMVVMLLLMLLTHLMKLAKLLLEMDVGLLSQHKLKEARKTYACKNGDIKDGEAPKPRRVDTCCFAAFIAATA